MEERLAVHELEVALRRLARVVLVRLRLRGRVSVRVRVRVRARVRSSTRSRSVPASPSSVLTSTLVLASSPPDGSCSARSHEAVARPKLPDSSLLRLGLGSGLGLA